MCIKESKIPTNYKYNLHVEARDVWEAIAPYRERERMVAGIPIMTRTIRDYLTQMEELGLSRAPDEMLLSILSNRANLM